MSNENRNACAFSFTLTPLLLLHALALFENIDRQTIKWLFHKTQATSPKSNPITSELFHKYEVESLSFSVIQLSGPGVDIDFLPWITILSD